MELNSSGIDVVDFDLAWEYLFGTLSKLSSLLVGDIKWTLNGSNSNFFLKDWMVAELPDKR